MIIHADDYGITAQQARQILSLSDLCGGSGPLSSASVFVNSPAFPESADLVRPYIASNPVDPLSPSGIPKTSLGGRAGGSEAFSLRLHLNLVEGPCCSDPHRIPLLVDGRGMFRNDFGKLMAASFGPQRARLQDQLRQECRAQIGRFLAAFPQLKSQLQLDSHQHVHAIPLVLDALMDAVASCGAHVSLLRLPAEPIGPHLRCATIRSAGPANLLKTAILDSLCRRDRKSIPRGCVTPLFCGVTLSGRMSRATAALAQQFEQEAKRRMQRKSKRPDGDDALTDGQAELLFHPVSVPVEECLDPDNEPFAQACASPIRDEEAKAIRRLGRDLGL